VVSYEHAGDLVETLGETGWTASLIPLTVDDLIYASSMVKFDSARRKIRVPALTRWPLVLRIIRRLLRQRRHGLGQGPMGVAIAVWPAIALVGLYELLTTIIRRDHAPATQPL
jgi:hypothetical protein